jgi:NTP pyrophosphatase (non-canonical NTP hydrolase)
MQLDRIELKLDSIMNILGYEINEQGEVTKKVEESLFDDVKYTKEELANAGEIAENIRKGKLSIKPEDE